MVPCGAGVGFAGWWRSVAFFPARAAWSRSNTRPSWTGTVDSSLSAPPQCWRVPCHPTPYTRPRLAMEGEAQASAQRFLGHSQFGRLEWWGACGSPVWCHAWRQRSVRAAGQPRVVGTTWYYKLLVRDRNYRGCDVFPYVYMISQLRCPHGLYDIMQSAISC
jgi:hypothetical protein